MCQNVRFEVGRLSKLFVASVEWADIGPVTRVDSHMSPEVKVKRKPLATPFKGALERLLARVDQLMSFQLGALDKGLSTFGTDVNTWTVGVQVFSHCRIVPEHL